jgi:PAS domain S-box-containing protein
MLVDSLPCILFTFTGTSGASCKLCYCNNNLTEVFGITPLDLLDVTQLPFAQLTVTDRTHITQLLDELVQGRHNAVECRFAIFHNQQNYWFVLQAALEQNSAGLAVTPLKFQATIHEITQQYAEQQQSMDSANYFLNLLDHLPDRFYYKDAQSRYLGGNKAWRDFHNISNMRDWLGKSDFDSIVFEPEFKQRLYEQEQAMMRSGVSIRARETIEHTDGSRSYADSIKTPLYDAEHNPIGLVGLTRDITEQVKIEQALAQAKLAAEAAVKAKSAFLAVMSHEIRTPMNGVIGCASLLADTSLTEEQQQLVHTIQSCGEGLLVIINDILDYSKIEADQLTLDSHSFNLRELAEDTFDLFGKVAADKRIEINYLIDPEIPRQLDSDSSRIRQVLINLLGNAIKFTAKGEVTLCCSLSSINVASNQCVIHFEIRDTGIGIPAQIQPRLFEAFTQADASITRKFGGTGLGLAISKRIVQALGGEISFTSTEGQGTSFNFDLPCKYLESITLQADTDSQLLRGKHALVVDDNATNRKILAATLKQWQMNCTCFAAPDNALENFTHGHHYDIAILDQCMPQMQGTELAKKLQAHNPSAPIPVIILSSAAERLGDASETFQYLQKPAHNSQLGALPEPSKPTKTVSVNNNTRILVVEDNSVNQMVICKMLEKLGYRKITAVGDGSEAVDICQRIQVDIILMDIQMLVMDGYSATQQIRANNGNSYRPWIIALTAGVQKEDTERALASGMNDFATKPIQLEQLQTLLDVAQQQLILQQH